MSHPQHNKARRLRLASAALGIGAVIALAGCSAGQMTETDTQVAAVNGASGQVKDIGVRDAQFSFPSGGALYKPGASLPVEVVLANDGENADRLVQVSSPYATGGRVTGTTDLPARTVLRAFGKGDPTQGHTPEEKTVVIYLDGIKQTLRPGVTIPVDFVFANAGTVTVQVPIGPDHHPRPENGAEGADEGH